MVQLTPKVQVASTDKVRYGITDQLLSVCVLKCVLSLRSSIEESTSGPSLKG